MQGSRLSPLASIVHLFHEERHFVLPVHLGMCDCARFFVVGGRMFPTIGREATLLATSRNENAVEIIPNDNHYFGYIEILV